MGYSGVGKSCMLLQYTDQRYREKHEVTIGVEFGAKLLKFKENNIKLQIWDTVMLYSLRLARRASRPSPEDTTGTPSEQLSFTISPTGTASRTSPSGSRKPRPTGHPL